MVIRWLARSLAYTPVMTRSLRVKSRRAVEAMLLVVQLNGPTMMARIGVMRALNRNVVREFDSN
jgi:hypothetical protein